MEIEADFPDLYSDDSGFIEEKNMKRIPQVGEKLHFFDDGKISDGRHYMAVVTHILTKERTYEIYLGIAEYDNLIDIWKEKIAKHSSVFAKDTDYFIGCAIPQFDNNILWFACTKDGGWFSMSIQNCWQGGELDVDGEYYQSMIDEGYEFSETI